MAHVQDNAAESVRRVHGATSDEAHANTRPTRARSSRSKHHGRPGAARGDSRLHRDVAGGRRTISTRPEPVTRAAVLYAFRVMVEDRIPMNAGCLRPIRIVDPGRLHAEADLSGRRGRRKRRDLAARHQRAVRGHGGARKLAGHDEQPDLRQQPAIQYYETICSGSPAGRSNDGRGFARRSGVHTHMTNSRLTDPEVLELRFPVVMEDFHIRAWDRAAMDDGRAGTARNGLSVSWSRWNAPSCPRTGNCPTRPRAAAGTVRSARRRSAVTTARSSAWRLAIRRRSKPGRRSS